jgi:sterol desaturase/sphingolipid hydroxylase (fatty acid hydroxylase superfamily)
VDLTVAAIPGFFATMGLEHAWLERHAEERGIVAGRYERRDTVASLTMGVGSLVLPMAMAKALRHVTPGRGRHGKVLLGAVVGAAAVTTVADLVVRAAQGLPAAGTTPASAGGAEGPRSPAKGAPGASPDRAGGATSNAPSSHVVRSARRRDRRLLRAARTVSSSGAVVAVAGGIVAASTTWASRTAGARLWRRSGYRRDLGGGLLPALAAILAWDFVYYWNHRLMHESRWMWAIHVVHHSSERYNLSTALRQPVAGELGMFVPYGLLALAGIRPGLIDIARDLNLLYQYWIHTESVSRLGAAEEVLNTPSHHRAHHGSNRQYLDRNHGSILIVWDRLFGTFEREDEPVVYGLTRNIDTFDPGRIATHEYVDMFRDVAHAPSWRDRLGFVLRGPGWASARRSELALPSRAPAIA